MKIYLYIDDERHCQQVPDGYVLITTRSYRHSLNILALFAQTDEVIVDFDHDLGEQKTGYDVAKYIVENDLPLVGFRIHSVNPVGRMNIYQLLTHYGYSAL